MHQPVLLKIAIKYLNPKSNENFVDCTIGGAGHSSTILEKIKPDGKVLGIDADLAVIKRIKPRKRLILICGNFKNLKKIVQERDFGPINGILFDLGLSSWQIEESNRGFTFQKDEVLDMRFDPKNQVLTALEIINSLTEEELKEVFRKYGEEKYGWKVARQIIEERKKENVETTFALREIIKRAIPIGRTRRSSINRVLARIFQALRIIVNDELENLKQGLEQALEVLEPNGRLVVISFHSLEDRIVKRFFKEKASLQLVNRRLKILTKKPIMASEEEIKKNPRSRSAKLRAAWKNGQA